MKLKLEKTFKISAFRNFREVPVFILFCLLFVCFQHSFAQEIRSSVDSTSIKIGEEIILRLEVETDSTDFVVFPEKNFGLLEMIESYKIDTTFEAAKYRLIKKYGLTQFDSGAYTIPSQTISINNRNFYTDSINIEVRDVVVDTLKQKMYQIKPAVSVKKPPLNWRGLLVWLIPLLILAGLVFYFLRRKKLKEEAERQLPPYEEAIVALQKLDNSELLKDNKSKEYYSSLTEIVKRYLDREIDETALESTSEELIERLMMHKHAGNFDFDVATIKKLDEIFKRADLVKFARMQQESGQAKADRATVEDIINETKEIIPEPTEEELQETREFIEKRRKKQQQKKWIYAISGLVLIFVLAGGIYGSLTGFDNLKDKILGNELRELAEGNWIRSEYGYPAVVLETPEVLTRIEDDSEENVNLQVVHKKDVFSFSEMKSPLYVMVSTFQFKEDEANVDLESALDSLLDDMEEKGAKNLFINKDGFETGQGIDGIRAFGEFNLMVSGNRILKKTSSYELLVFAQQGGLQEVLIVYQDDEKYAKDIVERIIQSIELELTTGR